MESKVVKIENSPQNENSKIDKNTDKIRLSTLFEESHNDIFLNEYTLFLAHYNVIPNIIQEINIDCKKANIWFSENYKNEIIDTHYNKRYYNRSKSPILDDIFYFLFEDLMVFFDTNQSHAKFMFRKTDIQTVERIIAEIKKFKNRKDNSRPEILLLVNSFDGIEAKPLRINTLKMNINDNYNDEFIEIHKTILKRLSKNNDKGLVLLHGKPGTGKTSYIRFLISKLKKNVIFLPPNMASSITNPNLISILIDNPNSIFVIEDAENIVVDREKDGQSPVSALLNISDGLLSDCLNIQIICSFNTDISKVDSALMRKGRLIAKYEFKELEIEKAQKLSDHLGFNSKIDTPMTLTAIYNQEEKDFQDKKAGKTIGFVNKQI
ncbi:MAG: AAA family ATPase [Bacteroidota bacterium]|nr:AAA family ATPase [Bacteroidota bacterium]